jgi:hypothetical protein
MKPKINVGYISLFTLFLIVVLLVIAGFYGWQKYQEKKFPEMAAKGEIKGISYYVSGIKGKINAILERKDVRNKRALELAEETKKINDKAGLYSIDIPRSWAIEAQEANKNNRISYLAARSSYLSIREISGKKYYDAGAKFTASVTGGENRSFSEGDSGHGSLIKTGKDSTQGGEYVYHVSRDPDSADGEIIDAHFIHNGRTYLFAMAYNPKNFTDAEYTFKEIMYSVSFK